MALTDITWGINMRSFTTDKSFRITDNKADERFLFEHLESYANGMRFLIQEKNEHGLWGGRGTDVQFTFPYTSATKARVVAFYCEHVLPSFEDDWLKRED